MTNVLRINQGALSAKATLVDGDWNALSLSEQAVGPHYLSDGRVEQYSPGPTGLSRGAGRDAVSKSGFSIDGVAIAGQDDETALAWDPDLGQPLSNMIVRPDPRSDAANAAVKVHPPTFAEPTGPVFDPHYSAANRAWLRR